MPVACSAPSTPGRHSSGVERTLGKGEVESSILSGGTIFPQFYISHIARSYRRYMYIYGSTPTFRRPITVG